MKEPVNGIPLHLDRSVYDLARERFDYLLDAFDHLLVAFSGGKDSTAVLNCALEVAADRKSPPVKVVFWDEEAIAPETAQYVARVAARDDVDFYWLCTASEQRNACSREHQHWYPWLEDDRSKWCRELPAGAIRNVPGTHKKPIAGSERQFIEWLKTRGEIRGSVAWCMGIRCQESMTRRRAITSARGDYAWVKHESGLNKCYPVYDWTVEDVWLAPALLGWDYNRAYEVQCKAGLSLNEQRISPPFGEQPIRNLWMWSVCWPELWDRMIERVPGAAACARYANTSLYGIGTTVGGHASYRDKALASLEKLPESARAQVADAFDQSIRHHFEYTADAMPDADPHPVSGYCWRELAKVATIGNNKLGRQAQKVHKRALEVRRENGVTPLPNRNRRPADR